MILSTEPLEGDVIRALLDGRLDIEGVAEIDLRMKELAGSARFLLVDLRNVSFLGSMGLHALVVSAQAVRRRGGKVAIFGPAPMVEQVLRASNMDRVIPIFHELDSALAVLR